MTKRLLIVMTGTLGLAVGTADAGLLSWSQATYATDGTVDGTGVVLDSTGGWTYEVAWNTGSASNVTVNGVQFLGTPDTAGVDISSTGVSNPSVTNQNVAPDDQFTGDFQTLMSSLAADNFADTSDWIVTLDNLTVGTTYRVQFLSYQSVSDDNQDDRQMEIFFGSTSGATTGSGDFSFSASTVGYSNTATFVAETPSQTFFVQPIEQADLVSDFAVVNGVSVYSIPEPSSLALLGLGGLMIGARRRRG